MGNSKSLVISVHGIRTRGKWQKLLTDLLSDQDDFRVRTFDYGYYRVDKFLRKAQNERLVDWFLEEYDRAWAPGSRAGFDSRPSVVAHSFGTYLACYSMLKYSEIVFDKMVLCGCILPRDFPWSTVFERDQVYMVRHEFGAKDFWTKTVRYFVGRTGDSGFCGFDYQSKRLIEQRYDEYTHSDFFSAKHIKEVWIPFLQSETPRLQVKHGREMKDLEEFRSIGMQTGSIDEQVYGEIAHFKENEVTLKMAEKWVAAEPDIYTFLFDRKAGRYVGYINAMPVSQRLFDKIKTQGIRDKEVWDEEITPLLPGQDMKLYIISIAVAPQSRSLGQGLFSYPLETLFYGFFDKLAYYAKTQKIRVSEVVAVGWTKEGRKICEHLFGMEKVGADEYGYPIYHLAFDSSTKEQKRPFRAVRKLMELYEELGLS